MDDSSAVITHPKFRMWLRPDGLVQVVWVSRVAIVLEDATATSEAMARLTGGRRSPLLVDMRDAGPQDRATRATWARPSAPLSAVALIVASPLSRMMGNLFITANRPTTPTRLFDNEASAVAWLKGFLG
jgi:hypothetical protein